MMKKIVPMVVGLVLFFAWSQFRDGGSYAAADGTPEIALGGGGGMVTVSFTTNQPARLRTGFSIWDEETDDEDGIHGDESFGAGSHVRTVDVHPQAYLYFELGVPDATPGAEVSWTISVDGRTVIRESERLDEPLGSGYAFFLQAEAENVAQLRSWGR